MYAGYLDFLPSYSTSIVATMNDRPIITVNIIPNTLTSSFISWNAMNDRIMKNVNRILNKRIADLFDIVLIFGF